MKKIGLITLIAYTVFSSLSPLQSVEASSFDPYGVKIVHAGEGTGVLVTNNNLVYTYGYSWFGNRGDGSGAFGRQNILSNISTSGDLASRASDDDIVQVQTGSFYSTLLTESGNLYYFGRNDKGAAGDGTTSDLLVPTLISNKGELATLSATDKIVDYTVNPGNQTQIHVLTQEGRIFGWGTNGFQGSVGNGTTTNVITSPVEITSSGALATLEDDEIIIDLTNGYNHVYAITSTGRIIVWGNNVLNSGFNFPYLTNPQNYYPSPIELPLNEGAFASFDSDEKIISIHRNSYTGTLFQTNKDRLIYSGNNENNMSGNGALENTFITSFEVTTQGAFNELLPGERIRQVESTYYGFIVLTTQNRFIGWGYNGYGHMGIGSNLNIIGIPRIVANTGVLAGTPNDPVRLYNAFQHSMVITQSGKMIVWGFNGSGGLYFSLVNPYDPNSLVVDYSNAPIDISFVYQTKVLDVLTNDVERINAMIANLIPVSALTLDQEDDVAYIRNFYENLTNEDKGGVLDLQTLIDAEAHIAALILLRNAAVQPVITQIDALPSVETLTLNDKLAVEAARNALEALPTNYQDYVTNQATLIALEAKIQELEDAARVQAIEDAINDVLNNPSDNPYDQLTRLETIESLYNGLSDANKANVTNYDSFTEEKTSILASIASIEAVIDAIDALPNLDVLTLEDEDVVEAARALYDALPEDLKPFVDNLIDLEDAEEKLALLNQAVLDQQAANAVINLINALPTPLTLEDEDLVTAAREAWDALTEDQQDLVTNTSLLVTAETTIEDLHQAQAQTVIDLIGDLPSVDDLTKDDLASIEAARAAYDGLTSYQKTLVTNYQTLVDIEAAFLLLPDGLVLTETMWILIAALAGAITALLFWIFFKGRSKEEQLVVAQPTPVKVAKPVSKPVEVKVEPKKVEEPVQTQVVQPTITTIQLDEVVLPNFETRPVLKPLSKVNPGHYLEVTKEKESTNRVVEVNDALPEALDDSNAFVSITKEEVSLVKLSLASTANFVKKTPGSFVDPGYYVEVNLEDEIVDNYILAKKRLPPSSAKGHRWIRIEKRSIRSKK